MKIINKDLKNGTIKLRVDDNEDLWTLKKIINEDDIISAETTRKIKKEEGQEGKRRTIYLKLKAEKIEFNQSSFTLKILGKITEAPEDVPVGSYHSFTISPGDELTITKQKWGTYELKELSKSERKTSRILITILDNQEATHALLTNEIKELYTHESSLPAKNTPEYGKKTSDYYNEIYKQIKELTKKEKTEYLIIAGPGFASEELMKIIKTDKELTSKTFHAHTNHTGMNGVKELINNEYINKIVNENEVSEETRLIEEFFKRVGKEKFITYGLENVKIAAENGSIDTLIISEGVMTDAKERKTFKEIENLISRAEETKARIEFINVRHDAGKRFYRFSGIGALLRY